MAPGIEMGDINWVAFALTVVSNIVLGFLWYAKFTPTGKVWMREVKMDPDAKVEGSKMAMSMVLMVVGVLLLMFVFQHTNLAYRDAYRLDGERLGADGLTIADGLTGGFFTFIGFFLPQGLSLVAFENRSWALFGVNQSYNLVTMLIAGAILGVYL